MSPVLPISLVFLGCCSNVLFLEELVKVYPNSGNTLTFCAFIFNCLEGLLFTGCLNKPPAIPIRYYSLMVGFFFIVQTLNNYTFGFNISMPLHIIFRAGSLTANLILGVLILKKSYKPTKYVSVVLITCGITMCTIASANQKERMVSHGEPGAVQDYISWVTGLCLLVLSLFLSARMGIFQEQTFAKFGKHPTEAFFYNHFLPLPGFLLLMPDIISCLSQFNKSAPYLLPVVGVAVPWAWLWLLLSTVAQYVCIKSVFILTTECSSLTVTLVVTLRKFVSLLLSVLYFQNPFTPAHWMGALLVLLGTLMFVEVLEGFSWYQRLEAALAKYRKIRQD